MSRAPTDTTLLDMGAAADNTAMQTILVVDDEEIVRDVVVRYLERDGFRTIQARDGLSAQQLIEEHEDALALVVLDLMLPSVNGLELCRWIRSRGRGDLPVIMLTARSDEADRIVGLEIGADDYIAKPFSPRELAARVRTVLRRAGTTRDASDSPVGAPVTFGEFVLDPRARQVLRGNEALRLTVREFDLLEFFARNPGEVFSRDQLMARVWGYDAAFDTGTVSVHVRRLREKIEADPSEPRHIQTVWGVGYRFSP